MSLNSRSKRLRNAPHTYVGNCVQSRQVDDVSRLSDFQVASEWPTLTGLPNNPRLMALDFGEGAAQLDWALRLVLFGKMLFIIPHQPI